LSQRCHAEIKQYHVGPHFSFSKSRISASLPATPRSEARKFPCRSITMTLGVLSMASPNAAGNDALASSRIRLVNSIFSALTSFLTFAARSCEAFSRLSDTAASPLLLYLSCSATRTGNSWESSREDQQ